MLLSFWEELMENMDGWVALVVPKCDGNEDGMILAVTDLKVLILSSSVSSVVTLTSKSWTVWIIVTMIVACVVPCSSNSTRRLFCSRC